MEAHGSVGTGKTLSIIREVKRWKDKHPDAVIYSNIELLKWDHIAIKDPGILFEIEKKAIVVLDELWQIADSRKGASAVNDVMNMLLIQSRRMGWFVVYTQQDYKQTDKRIRFITELWLEPEMHGKWVYVKYFSKEGKFLADLTFDGSKYWGFYDTEKRPYTLNLEKLKALWDKHNQRF